MKKPDWVRPSLDEASDRVLLLLIGQSTWLTERVIAERLRYRDGEVRTAMVRLVRDGYAAPHGRIHGTGELTYEHTFEGAEFMQAGGYREQNMLPRPQTAIPQTQPEIGMAYGDYTREQMIMHLLKHIEHHPFNGLGIDSRNVRNSLALKMKIEQFEPALLWAETHDVVRRTKEGDIVPGKEGYAILKAGSIDAWEQARTQPGAGLWVGTNSGQIAFDTKAPVNQTLLRSEGTSSTASTVNLATTQTPEKSFWKSPAWDFISKLLIALTVLAVGWLAKKLLTGSWV